jgi:integrase
LSIFYKLNYLKKKELYSVDDKVGIQIVYYFDKKRISFSTNINVKIKDWDDHWRNKRTNEPVLSSDKDFKTKNILLLQKWMEIKDVIFEIRKNDMVPSTDLVKSYMRRESSIKLNKSGGEIHFEMFLNKYLKWINSPKYLVETRNSISYVRSVVGSVTDIIRFTKEYQVKNSIKLLPSDIDKNFTNELIIYSDKRGLQPSTIKKRIKVLVMFGKWLEENHGVKMIVHKPKRDKDKDKEILFLKDNELVKLHEFKGFEYNRKEFHLHYPKNVHKIEFFEDILKNDKVKKYTSYEVYKDLLLMLCGLGLRYIDGVNLKLIHFKELDKRTKKDRKDSFVKGEFVLTPQKTSVVVRIPNTPLTWEIYKKYSSGKGVDDYLFPRTRFGNSISNTKFNKHIKEISRIVGLNRVVVKPKYDWNNQVIEGTDNTKRLHQVITSHIGRKTMIRTYVDVGYDRKTIMSITGIQNYKTLDVYYETSERDRFKFNNLLHQNIDTNLKSNDVVVDEKDKLFEMYKRGDLTWEQLGKLINN